MTLVIAGSSLITVRGVAVKRTASWVEIGIPIPCPSGRAHIVGATWGVLRGAVKCRYGERGPQGTVGPDCGRIVYIVTVREIGRRYVAEIMRGEAPALDEMSDAGALAYFRARWPDADAGVA